MLPDSFLIPQLAVELEYLDISAGQEESAMKISNDRLVIIRLILLVIIAALILAGCQGEREDTVNTQDAEINTDIAKEEVIDYVSGKTMLFQYYYRVTGTPMEMPFSRITIYTFDDEHLLLEICRNGGTGEERVYGYLVSADAYEKVLEVIKEYRMDHWEEEEGYPIDGAYYNCLFRIGEDMHQASSEHMPDSGFRAFGAVENAAYSLADDGSLLYDRYTDPDYEAKKAENLRGTVKDKEELLSYVKTIDINRWNCKKYMTITSGMGMYDENHKNLDHRICYVLVWMKPGYYPCSDLYGEYAFTVVKEDGSSFKAEGKLDQETKWGFDPNEDAFRAHPTVYDDADIGSIRSVKLKKIKGKVAYFDIPAELIHEDENGSFFFFQGKQTKYYLNGYTAYIEDEGEYFSRSDIWVRDILFFD